MALPSPRQVVSAVRAFARRHGIFRPGPIVLAVSGGTDSTALALIASEIREEFGLVLHVAHFDHRTRPGDAAKDAQYVAELANRIGAPIRVGRAERAPKSEDEAREQRYEFLRRVAKEIGATAIVTAHTLDDQAETVLLHLTRGAGIVGASGMRPLRDGIARPLLAITRADTSVMCRAARVRPREDPSNRSLKFARNRVRRNVLPELAKINPQVKLALSRFADAAADVDATARHDRETSGARDVASSASSAINVAALPPIAADRGDILVNWWRDRSGKTLGARHRRALLDLIAATGGTQRLDLPGGTAVREYAYLRHAPPTAGTPENARTDPPVRLSRGAAVTWHGWRITSDMASDGLPFAARIDDATASKLTVRGRRPGDRVPGRGKLQDVFVNAKVPARQRDTWPLITVEQDVIWVPGVTRPPAGGEVLIAAGRVGDTPTTRMRQQPGKTEPPEGLRSTKGEDLLGNQSRKRRLASMSEARRKGGNRGPR